MKSSAQFKQSGFSLIELLIVIIIIGLIASFAFSRFLSVQDAGSGERAVSAVAAKIGQRRDEAVRLNGLTVSTSLESQTAPLVTIDFGDLPTTASLFIDGTDANRDGIDDDTLAPLTRLQSNNWSYAYRPDRLQLPGSWTILQNPPTTVGNISDGRGVPVTRVGFDGDGRAYGYVSGVWQKYPALSSSSSPAAALLGEQNTPFWAVYIGSRENAVAVAIYPSGQTEKFRFDGSLWRGWRASLAR